MAQMAVVGSDVLRRDGPEKLTGRAQYAGDIRMPGMLYARLVLSPHASAKITSIDTEAARQMPGVTAVYTADDLEGTLLGYESGSRRLNFLAKGHVVFAGQPVAVVLAQSEARAEDAAAAVEVSYEPSAAVVDPIKGMQHGAPRVREHLAAGAQEQDLHAAVSASEDEEEHEDLHDNVSNTLHFKRGDVEQGFREADVIVEDTYKIAGVHQGYLETQSCMIAPDPVTDGVTVYTSTQAQFMTRDEVAKALGLPSNKVRCVAMTVGGGFGAKYVVIEPFVASLVKKTNRPVHLQYTRSEDFLAANPSPYAVIECKTGAKKDGTLTAMQARVVFDTGAYAGSALGIACLLIGGWYRFPNLDIRGYEVVTNKPGVGAYRAPGAPHASFAIESQMDDLAEKLGMDPLDLRLQNAIVEGDLWPDGNPWPRIGLVECLEALKKHPALAEPPQPPGERGRRRRRGRLARWQGSRRRRLPDGPRWHADDQRRRGRPDRADDDLRDDRRRGVRHPGGQGARRDRRYRGRAALPRQWRQPDHLHRRQGGAGSGGRGAQAGARHRRAGTGSVGRGPRNRRRECASQGRAGSQGDARGCRADEHEQVQARSGATARARRR